jgi:putative transposase
MPLQDGLSIEHMCQLVAVSRKGFYRSLQHREPAEEETEVRSLIQQIALEQPRRHGYRRVSAELHRRGVPVNRKKVARMMRDDNLMAMQPKRFVVTTNSKHKGCIPKSWVQIGSTNIEIPYKITIQQVRRA